MKNKVILAPSILNANFSVLGEQLDRLAKSGAEYVHIDVMDGRFVPNITIGPPVIKSLREGSGLVFDVHLMIEFPARLVDSFIDAGADIVNIHLESAGDHTETLKYIRKRGKKTGLTIKPATAAHKIFGLLPYAAMVLVMTVEPGFGGQKIMPSCLGKIAQIRSYAQKNGLCPDIQADGGINLDNAASVVEAGANIIVAGSAIFENGEIEQNVKSFLDVLNS